MRAWSRVCRVCWTDARKESLHSEAGHPAAGGRDSPTRVSYSRPIFTSSRGFVKETAIWDSPAWSYGWKRLREVSAPAMERFLTQRSGGGSGPASTFALGGGTCGVKESL